MPLPTTAGADPHGFSCPEPVAADTPERAQAKVLVSSGYGRERTVAKLLDLGARPVTASDSSGFIHDPDGIDRDKLAWIKELKEVRRGR